MTTAGSHGPLAALGLPLAAGATGLQGAITIPSRLEVGDPLPLAVVFFLSFLTVLSNLGCALAFASALVPRGLGWFRRHDVRTALAGLIVMVALGYWALLSWRHEPEGVAWWANLGQHTITPALYLLWWALLPRAGPVPLARLPAMMAFPAAYLLYTVARQALTGHSPYPFVDADALGWGPVLVTCAGLMAALAGLTGGLIALDRGLPRALVTARAPDAMDRANPDRPDPDQPDRREDAP